MSIPSFPTIGSRLFFMKTGIPKLLHRKTMLPIHSSFGTILFFRPPVSAPRITHPYRLRIALGNSTGPRSGSMERNSLESFRTSMSVSARLTSSWHVTVVPTQKCLSESSVRNLSVFCGCLVRSRYRCCGARRQAESTSFVQSPGMPAPNKF